MKGKNIISFAISTIMISAIIMMSACTAKTPTTASTTTPTTTVTTPTSIQVSMPVATAPMVTSTYNANGATNVPVNTKVGVFFTKLMDPATLTANTFTLQQGNTPVSGSVTLASYSSTFTPAVALTPNTLYTATITTGAKDLDGNALANPYVWSFTTATAPDIIPPWVTGTINVNGATNVSINTKIGAFFTEVMDPLTVTTATFTVMQGTTPVNGTVNYIDLAATFTPAAALSPSTLYTATISTGAKDLVGNALANPYIWSFTTGAAPDTTAPTVSSTIPVNGATSMAVNSAVAAVFSETMDPLTVTTATFMLMQGTTPISGIVTYLGVTATFTPTIPLSYNVVYTATITTGAKDLAGNAMAANFTWSFSAYAGGGGGGGGGGQTPSSAKAINSFGFIMPAVTGVINESAKTILVTVPFGTPVTALIATFTTTGTGVIVGTTTQTSLSTPNNFTNPVAYIVTAADNSTVTYTVTVTVAANSAKAITAYSFAGYTGAVGTINEGNKTIAVTVPYGTPVTALIATFTTTGTGVIVGTTVQTSTTTPNNFTNPVAYIVTAGDTSTVTYSVTVTITQSIPLGLASTFAIMATSAISGSGNHITGDVGLNPGSAQGILPAEITGTIHVDDTAVIAAQVSLLAAFNDAVSRSINAQTLQGNLGGLTKAPGLYVNGSSSGISGTGANAILTLDAGGDANAVFIFKMASTFIMDPGTSIVLSGNAQAKNVYFWVGSSATLDTTTIFKGNILAAVTITVNNGSNISGRLFAGAGGGTGAVTVQSSTITVPTP